MKTNVVSFAKKLLFMLLAMPVAAMASTAVHVDKAPINVKDHESLQRGAAVFVNYCLNCHSANYMRYNRMQDFGLSEQQIKDNLLFAAEKPGETMKIAMRPKEAKEWFGAAPPDLSVIARSRGADWIYTYLRGFYRDNTRPTGWNNTVFPNVGMPHVLYQYQGGRELTIEEEKPVLDEKTHKVIGGEHVETVFDENGEKTVKTQKLEHAPGHATHHSRFTVKTQGSKSALEYDQMSADLVNFLTWAGEPAQVKRFRTGVWVLVYLVLLFALAYAMKRAFWKDVH